MNPDKRNNALEPDVVDTNISLETIQPDVREGISVEEGGDLAPITLENAVREENRFTPNVGISSTQERANAFVTIFQSATSGFLAVALWLALIGVGSWHAYMTTSISNSLIEVVKNSNNSEKKPDFEAYDKVSSMVGDTAKTLYAVITPLATAVTAFYFATKSNKSESSDDDAG